MAVGLNATLVDALIYAMSKYCALNSALNSEEIGSYRTVAAPMRFGEADVSPRGPAPKLGQHTRQVLIDSGFTGEEVNSLVADGAVGEMS